MKLLVGAREAEELVDDEGLAVELLVDHHAKNSELSGPEEGRSAGWEVWRVSRMPGEQFIHKNEQKSPPVALPDSENTYLPLFSSTPRLKSWVAESKLSGVGGKRSG